MEYFRPMDYLIVINGSKLKIVSDGKKSIMNLSSNKMMAQMQDMLTACMIGDLSKMSSNYQLEYFEFTAIYHDEIIHRAEVFHTDFIAFLVVELPFGSNLFVEYIEIFHLGKIAFDRLYGLCLLCQAVFKLGLLHHLFHALCMDGGDRQEEKR